MSLSPAVTWTLPREDSSAYHAEPCPIMPVAPVQIVLVSLVNIGSMYYPVTATTAQQQARQAWAHDRNLDRAGSLFEELFT